MYKSSDGLTTTGLGVNVYYDSSLLTLVAVDDQLSAMVASNTFGQDLADETNKDSDDSTDKYVNLVWGDFMGSWAGGTDPYTLANLKFKIAEGADLTEASTSIRIEESDTAIGYNFYGQDLNLGEEQVDETGSTSIVCLLYTSPSPRDS